MDQDAIVAYVAQSFAGVDIVRPTDGAGAGDTFFIYDPDHNLTDQQRFPFATIVVKDYGEWDNRSQLDREGVWRLNVGVSRQTFRALFPSDDVEHDYTALDRLIPHPEYAAQSWVSVLNPSLQTFNRQIEPLLAEAYNRVVHRINPREPTRTLPAMFTGANLTIMVTDFERSVRFYTDTLGLKLKFRAGNEWADVEAPGVAIGLHPAGGYAPTGSGGGMSLGLQVEDIETAIATLTARGVDFPQGWQPSGQLRLANFADPDGTQLYLFQMVHGQ